MISWWAALLGGRPQTLNLRMTAITGFSMRVVIERSQIALAYHPEASGVIGVNLVLADVQAVQPMLQRLARLTSLPRRATREPGAIALGCAIPTAPTWPCTCRHPLPASPQKWTCCLEEVDVNAVLAAIGLGSHDSDDTRHPPKGQQTDGHHAGETS